MAKDDDTAALIAEAQAWVERARFEWENYMPPGVMPPKHASLIARLAAALERAQHEAEGYSRDALEAQVERDHWKRKADDAQADAARMRGALEPFAVEYDRQAEYWPDKARVKAWAPFATAYRITIDDLRAARAALEPPHD